MIVYHTHSSLNDTVYFAQTTPSLHSFNQTALWPANFGAKDLKFTVPPFNPLSYQVHSEVTFQFFITSNQF